MKRDMELARKILLEVERWGPDDNGSRVSIDGSGQTETDYHVALLIEAGLLEGTVSEGTRGRGVPTAWVRRMTWAGHDFVDAARNDAVWRKTMGKIGSAVGSASIDVVKAVLQKIATGEIAKQIT